MIHLLNLFKDVTGSWNETGPVYGFWSGFGGSIPDFLLLGGIITLVRHQNCGVKRCYRFGRHEYDLNGVKHKLCRKHHPGIESKPTAADFAAHHKAKRQHRKVEP